MTTSTVVSEILARARDAILPAMTGAVESLSPEVRQVAAYHMGWTDAGGRPANSPGGKGIRPALALLGAAAAWAEPEVGIPGGVAVELVHNFSLIHDDIIDLDTERHHRPTVWSVYGVGPAIVAGDALQVLAHQVLLDSAPETGPRAVSALAAATAEMIAGQADDISFEGRSDVSVEQCTAMSAAKTGALLGCATAIGAILAGATEVTVSALNDYGRHLGLAFQAVDDLLGIWGDPTKTGKPAGSDLRRRKKSMPIVAALAAGGADSDELRSLISPTMDKGKVDPMTPDEVERGTYLVEACGGRQWTEVRAKSNLDAALRSLDRVRMETVARRELADIAVFVVERDL